MKLKYALMGLVALGGVALGTGSASAMPLGLNGGTVVDHAGITEQVRLVCDRYGRCFRTHGRGYGSRHGYGGGRYGYGGGYGSRHGHGGGRGYGHGGGRGGGRGHHGHGSGRI